MFWKIKAFVLRLLEFILRWPYRFFRFMASLFFMDRPRGRFIFLRYVTNLFFKVIDLTPIPLFIETILDIIKWKTRPLTTNEKKVVESVFGHSIWYSLIGLDPDSWPVKKGKAMAYVSLHTINFQKDIPDHILVHEMTHIWQYKKHGSCYITEALYAQRWGGGYNYGGEEALLKNSTVGMKAFNFEQQAEIVEDYYKSSGVRDAFDNYINEIRNS